MKSIQDAFACRVLNFGEAANVTGVQEGRLWTTLARQVVRGFCVLKMSHQVRLWRLVLPMAILLLLVGTTASAVWHYHTGLVADNCPICHMSHQTVGPSVAHVTVYRPVRMGSRPEPQTVHLVEDCVPCDVPARAPPV